MVKYQTLANKLPALLEEACHNDEARFTFIENVVKCAAQSGIRFPQEELLSSILKQWTLKKGDTPYQKKLSEAFICAIELARGEPYSSLAVVKHHLKQVRRLRKQEFPRKAATHTAKKKLIKAKALTACIKTR